jgi:proteasome lid subunit RPN8/RPN11
MNAIRVVPRPSPWSGRPLASVSISAQAMAQIERGAWRTREGPENGGLLAGTLVDAGEGVAVMVSAAYATPSHDRSIVHFSFDPDAIHRARSSIAKAGEQVVGWYHTHPGGVPFMSPVDENLHRTSFREQWELSIVGSIVSSASMFGVWSLNNDEIVEVERYSIEVTDGTKGWEATADRGCARHRNHPEPDLTPSIMLTMAQLLGIESPRAIAALSSSIGASPAAQWGSVLDDLVPGDGIGGSMEIAGLIAAGRHVAVSGLSLASENDLDGTMLISLDRSRAHLWAIDLERQASECMLVSAGYGTLLDVAAQDDAAYVLTSSGQVLLITGFRGAQVGQHLSTMIVAVISEPERYAIYAVGGGFALVRRSDAPEAIEDAADVDCTIERVGEDDIVGTWDGQLVRAPRRPGRQFEVNRLTDGWIERWTLPGSFQDLTITGVQGAGSELVATARDMDDRLVVFATQRGQAAPTSLWLGARNPEAVRAFPFGSPGSALVVEHGCPIIVGPEAC